MTHTELNLNPDGYNFTCKSMPAKSHYKFLMGLGRVFPTTKAQVKYFISENCNLDVLNYEDVQLVESLLNKHGFKGEYKYTKSQTWVRLENQSDLKKALKLEHNI